MAFQDGSDLVYDARRRFLDEGLRSDGSLFTPGRSIFSPGNLQDLHRRFNEQPDESSASFLDKFERQLAGADDVIQLGAELLYVHLLFAADIGGPSKRETITRVLGWMRSPLQIPDDLDAALDSGLASTGVAFKTYRPNQLWLLIDTLLAWKELGGSERERLLADPWAFKTFLFGIPLTAAYTQREALLHLVHPETFEAIVSRDHKRLIADTFADRVPDGDDDVDRALAGIRASLQDERPGFRSFYEPGVVEVWRRGERDEGTDGAASTGTRAWLLRHKVAGKRRLEDWLENGYCSIGWSALGVPGKDGLERAEIAARLHGAFPDRPPGWQRSSAGNIDRFLNQMAVGDLVVTPDGDDVFFGIVTSPSRFVDDADEAHRRSVEWANPRHPVSREELSESAYSKLRTLLTVSEVTANIAEFAALAGIDMADTDVAGRPADANTEVSLPAADAQLAERVLLPQAWLQEVLDLLERKRQLVFYGPPGTGKTYVAQRLADHLIRDGGTYTLVQFHPSYAYEDFFEGFRPRSSGTEGAVAFELVPGPLRRIAEQAAEDPENPYVLIIDELNRGNLAKVFGELYFLLEYRDQSIALQYSPEDEFSVPRNLFLIGTMNTADRSIALVDAAMRRRFYFVPFFPQRPPIDGLLRSWLQREGLSDEPAALLDALNARIDDADFAIGPSYLMTTEVATGAGMARIWRHAILPLLDEHYFGSAVDVEATFGLDALRRTVADASPGGAPDASSPHDTTSVHEDRTGDPGGSP